MKITCTKSWTVNLFQVLNLNFDPYFKLKWGYHNKKAIYLPYQSWPVNLLLVSNLNFDPLRSSGIVILKRLYISLIICPSVLILRVEYLHTHKNTTELVMFSCNKMLITHITWLHKAPF